MEPTTIKKLFIVAFLIVLLVACANEQMNQSDGGYIPAPVSTAVSIIPQSNSFELKQAEAQSTEAARQALQIDATRQYVAHYSTAAAQQATDTAVQATTISQQATAVYSAEQTRVVQEWERRATQEAHNMAIGMTRIALNALQTRAVDETNATRQAGNLQLQFEQDMAIKESARQDIQLQQAIAEVDRYKNMTIAWVICVLLGFLVATFYYTGRHAPKVMKVNGRETILVTKESGQYEVVDPKLLPSSNMPNPVLLPASVNRRRKPVTIEDNPPSPRNQVPAFMSSQTVNTLKPFGEKADWNLFCSWDDFRNMPLGVNDKGMISVNLADNPHSMVAGKSGSGKTSFALKPMCAFSLAKGENIIVVNAQGADFVAFDGFPNVTVINDKEDGVERIVLNLIEAVIKEATRRSPILEAHEAYTWDDLPNGADPYGGILIVIDEFVDLTDPLKISSKEAKHMLGLFARAARKCRKFGIRMVFAAQSPGQDDIGKEGMRIRRQCTRISFFLEDVGISQSIIGSPVATSLPPRGYFATRAGGLKIGVGFQPSSKEIRDYLNGRHIQPRPLPHILQEFVDSGYGLNQPSQSEEGNEVGDQYSNLSQEAINWLEKEGVDPDDIVSQWLDGASKRGLQRKYFEYEGGTGGRIIKSIIDSYENQLTDDDSFLESSMSAEVFA